MWLMYSERGQVPLSELLSEGVKQTCLAELLSTDFGAEIRLSS